MANSKGRFSLWVAPKALVFDRFFDWDFDISVGAIQGHSRVPGEVAEEALGKRLTAERCRNYMFYAKLDYESFLNHGHELYLTSNGVVLSYVDTAPMYPTIGHLMRRTPEA